MKHTSLASLLIIVMVFAFSGCSKNDPAPTSSTITYANNTSTPVTLVVGGQTQTIQSLGNVVLTGKPGNSLTGTATTSGMTTNGTQVGGKISWTINDTYPSSGNLTTSLDAEASVFFLEIVNNSSYALSKVYVNYGLQSQSLDNLSIPADGNTYTIGYYNAYTNSNVRTEGTNGGYASGNIVLPFTKNQVYTFTVVN